MESQVTFDDHKPQELSLYDAVIQGFSATQKYIPPKFFYDKRGSQLFDQICNQPEYYLPDVERKLIHDSIDEITDLIGKECVIIEPGAGNLSKIRLLLDKMQPEAYVPMDISSDFLRWAANNLATDYPWLKIHASCVDFTHSMPLPDTLPNESRLIFFPGSSLGNFHKHEAQYFLHMLRQTLLPNGMLLIGVDTKKTPSLLNAAYNDAAGITAEFNLNLLQRIRHELQADCNPNYFDHHAFYNENAGRIEMHLVSQRQQAVRINDHRFNFESGETVHTECSYKYAPDEFIQLAESAGFSLLKHWLAEDDLFAIYLLSA